MQRGTPIRIQHDHHQSAGGDDDDHDHDHDDFHHDASRDHLNRSSHHDQLGACAVPTRPVLGDLLDPGLGLSRPTGDRACP